MEIKRRMSIRFRWLLGVLILVGIGLLVACGSHYSASSSSNGLVIVPSQGSAVMQAFGFSLGNGHVSQINTSPNILGTPMAVVLDPAGAFAYVAIQQNSAITNSVNGIASYKVNSDGTLSGGGTPTQLTPLPAEKGTTTAPAIPVALTMDSAGKILFVADAVTTDNLGLPAAGGVSVLSIGSGGSLTEVSGSPFVLPAEQGGSSPNASSMAVTHMTFPGTPAACSGQTPPTVESLYVTDSSNNVVVHYNVDVSGALTPVRFSTSAAGISTGNIPSGVVVDPCDRFVYVTNQNDNNVSGYSICTAISTTCPIADGTLVSLGAPVSADNGPTALAIDPFGNFLYVVDTRANHVSGYRIAQVTGGLTALNPAVVATGSDPVSIAIRSDANWLFVTNNGSASVSQYAITPASGALSPTGTGITTDNFPWGVAAK
jgi:6-phosphogluconolactonase (cycloisomerase 2 family)